MSSEVTETTSVTRKTTVKPWTNFRVFQAIVTMEPSESFIDVSTYTIRTNQFKYVELEIDTGATSKDAIWGVNANNKIFFGQNNPDDPLWQITNGSSFKQVEINILG